MRAEGSDTRCAGLRHWAPEHPAWVATVTNSVAIGIAIKSPDSGYKSGASLSFTSPQYPPRRVIAIAQQVNGKVERISVTIGGLGYATPPPFLVVGPDGAGAKALATVTGDVVTGITVTDAGSGYSSRTEVRIASPPSHPRREADFSKIPVHLSVVQGRKCELETTRDLRTWKPVGTPSIAEDEQLDEEFNLGSAGRFFWVTPVP